MSEKINPTPALTALMNAFMEDAKERHSDKIGKIVLKRQKSPIAPHIQAFNEALQTHPELEGFSFHEFQTANGQPLDNTESAVWCCLPEKDPHCGFYC